MKDSLKILDRIKKFELDEQRRLLKVELDKEENLQELLKKLIEDFEIEKEFAKQNPMLCDFGIYVDQHIKKRRFLEDEILKVQQKIDQIRDVMADLFKEQKTFEIVGQNRQKSEE